jgi:hypothetical protein
MSSLPYAQRLQVVLHGHLLPHVIDLEIFNFTPEKIIERTIDFEPMTTEQVQRLALRLQEQQHVRTLKLAGHQFEPDVMRELSGSIAMQTGLQTLHLGSTQFLPLLMWDLRLLVHCVFLKEVVSVGCRGLARMVGVMYC